MLDAQRRRPDVVVVVDNASADGSQDMIRTRFPDVHLVRLTRNTGGAGGFSAGLAEAVDVHQADLVWAMDDDPIPSETTLAQLLASYTAYGGWVDGDETVIVMRDLGDSVLTWADRLTRERCRWVLSRERKSTRLHSS